MLLSSTKRSHGLDVFSKTTTNTTFFYVNTMSVNNINNVTANNANNANESDAGSIMNFMDGVEMSSLSLSPTTLPRLFPDEVNEVESDHLPQDDRPLHLGPARK